MDSDTVQESANPARYVAQQWLRDFARFEHEIHKVYEELVLPIQKDLAADGTQGHPNVAPMNVTLRAYIAFCFSWIDMLSLLWSRSNHQTRRMAAFMVRYMDLDGRTASIAVNLWRHTLAHGPSPQSRRNRTSTYSPVFSWVLPKSQHLSIEVWPDTAAPLHIEGRIATNMFLGLLNLVAQVEDALQRYTQALDTDLSLQENLLRRIRSAPSDDFL